LSKIRRDIYGGALAEFAVYNYFLKDGLNCSEPDLEIYHASSKSYDPDLYVQGNKIHVKSQTKEAAERWGLSWTFQKNDPLLKVPSDTDYLALCKTHGNAVEICAILKAKTVHKENLFSDCRVANYAVTKKVIYFEELEASKINLWEL